LLRWCWFRLSSVIERLNRSTATSEVFEEIAVSFVPTIPIGSVLEGKNGKGMLLVQPDGSDESSEHCC
jgi:hypothetical protein